MQDYLACPFYYNCPPTGFFTVNGKQPTFIELYFLRDNASVIKSLLVTGENNQVNSLNRRLRDSSLKSLL